MKVLIVNGHPREGSFSDAMTDAFVEGALGAGVDLQQLNLRDLVFEPNVVHPTPRLQHLEADIVHSQQLIAWADHLVLVYPTWWGTMPALLKAWLDRVLTAGFAFEEIEGGTGFQPLLRGKTAQLITTMDTPGFVYNHIYGAPGHKALKRATLGFCGFTMGKTLSFGPVRDSKIEKRKLWLSKIRAEAGKLSRGSISRSKRRWERVGVWARALRLQFYPMTFIAYATGAIAAGNYGYGYEPLTFWFGYAWLFVVEVATVFANEYFDFESDKNNKYFSPFSGGSRVVVDQLITRKQLVKGIAIAIWLAVLVGALLMFLSDAGTGITAALLVIIFIIAMGYTQPPLKLSYRGLGEITVGLTHSIAVVLLGYVLQGGGIADRFPWYMSLPLFFAVLPSITLAGIPDREADSSVSKKTIAVRFGNKNAARIAIVFTMISALSLVFFFVNGILQGTFNHILILVIPHAMLLIWLLSKYIRDPRPPHRIDSLMVVSLMYILWFVVVPVINLL